MQPKILPEDSAFETKPYKEQVQAFTQLLIAKWKLLLVLAVLGFVGGLVYHWIKPVEYIARTSFVVEESKAGSGNLMSALAGQFGFDLGSLSGTSGVLAGDNVLQLLKSGTLIKQTLLTPYDAKKSLADVYAETQDLKKKWEGKKKVGKWIDFPVGKKMDRLQDSLLKVVVQKIVEKNLSVLKPDRKLGFFELSVISRDEAFSQLFCTRLLKVATDFYVNTKTRRLQSNVQRLQAKADSLASTLNKKTYSAAETDRLLLNANPVYAAPTVSAEISSRDKYVQATIYGEIIKNLEISKTAMIQETPTVQVVDYPDLPLNSTEEGWWVKALSGMMAALVAGSVIIFLTGGEWPKGKH